MDDVFFLLDDCHATAAQPSSRLYTDYAHTRVCTNPDDIDAVWDRVQQDMRQGLHAVVVIDYEWGCKLQRAGVQNLGTDLGADLRAELDPYNTSSAFAVLLFRQQQRLSSAVVEQWLAEKEGTPQPSAAGIAQLSASVSRAEFEAGIDSILELIRNGETYQVNYTYRVNGQQYGSPIALYRRLRALQPVAFGALAALPQGWHEAEKAGERWILSCSPELFVRNSGAHLTTRPMKGTAAREADAGADEARRQWLAHDVKNQAENVMIVDLLRNDLSRISELGSVKVSSLCAVETYSTVHQMTSTIESTLRSGTGFPAVLRALFPCGSITGAPKLHTMDAIASLETTPRGLYCGAIGWIEPPALLPSDTGNLDQATAHGCGDFCLSVAIRTISLALAKDGIRHATLGLGSGVVIDSQAAAEFDETQLKMGFLTQVDPGFTLFETLRYARGHLRNLHLHVQRLQRSAKALGFRFSEAELQRSLQEYLLPLGTSQAYRLRIDLSHNGRLHYSHALLGSLAALLTTASSTSPASTQRPCVKLMWAKHILPKTQACLANYKTSLRSTYDQAIADATEQGAFDAIFTNARGEVSEGARSNILVQQHGRWYTPPLASGVLPGIMRERLLRMCPSVAQKVLYPSDLEQADALAVCSSLRGIVRAQLVLNH